MIFDFSFYLTVIVLLTGIVFFTSLFFVKKHNSLESISLKFKTVFDCSKTFFPPLLIVWVVRSFIIQPYHVLTGSLEPSVMPGDFIMVEQFAYGLRFPVINKKIFSVNAPKRGQIVVFRWPKNLKIIFVKRVIGLPGDHIVYKHKQLYINGRQQKQKLLYKMNNSIDSLKGYPWTIYVKEEDLYSIKHRIYIHSVGGEIENCDLVVPSKHYFVMGDNRDNSDDSRQWGFVPEQNLIGKAFFRICFSWDSLNKHIRWRRFGSVL